MSIATKARTKAETRRHCQVSTLDERRARHQTQQQLADAVLHGADKVNEMYAQFTETASKVFHVFWRSTPIRYRF